MILYLVTSYGWDDRSEMLSSFLDGDVARAWAKQHAQRHKDLQGVDVWRHDTDEPADFESVEEFAYVPPLYDGPTVKARLATMDAGPGYAHRVPIDCHETNAERGLTVDWPYRILDAETENFAASTSYEEMYRCRCKGWHIVEGSPEAVAGLIERYGGELVETP